MPEFLLEVGCEELPAPWLPGLTAQMAERFAELAGREQLEPSAVHALATPRRLVVRAEVRARQEDRETAVWGPSVKVARDAAGKWTSAALGFARKNAVAPDALRLAPRDPASPADEYLLFVRREEGRAAVDVLPAVIAGLLRGLAFPKRMSWDAWLEDGRGPFPFGRPIRWLVALLGGEVVPFTIHALADGARGEPIVASGDRTYGHRFLPRGRAGAPVPVRDFAGLQSALRDAFVVLDPAEREARIREGLAAAADARARPAEHPLVPEWRDLVEFPTVLVGGIPAEFQALPAEVLETVLVHHQKYIPLAEAGRPPTRFAAVINSDGAGADEIARGMQRVVVARLRDAAFFYGEDRKRPLEARVGDLAGVTFHRGLGTYRDKTERVVRLVEAMGSLGLIAGAQLDAARRAALLAKADLTTLMVREFPELQGVMGGLYLEGREPEAVAAAVRWHYHPLSVEEDAPPAGELSPDHTGVFAAVSLADKLDTLAGHFALGNAPTGSSDPYGLRRAAQGAVRVLIDFWPAAAARPSLRRLAPAALEPFVASGSSGKRARPGAEVTDELQAFLLERVRAVLQARGYPGDEVEAALGARDPDALDDPHEAWLRVRALHRVRQDAREDFEHLAVAFKRAQNILGQGTAAPSVEPALFREPAERGLHEAVARLAARDGDHEARLRDLAGLRGPVDRFFDDVLVMAEDESLRRNRLALLAQVGSLFYRVADIAKLGG